MALSTRTCENAYSPRIFTSGVLILLFINKKVIVTGANRSIGQSIALAFAKEGADVVISYRSDETGAKETEAKIKEFGRRSLALYADFAEMQSISEFATAAIDFLGGIDILVNNAGMLARENLFEIEAEKMQKVFQVNTIAPLYLTQICSKHMITYNIQGNIINISSIAGSITMHKSIAYGSSKAAVNKWTRHAALNLATKGIRVNTIAPGVIASGMNETTEDSNPELWNYYMENTPLKKAGTPQDIAEMCLYLASEKANFITGKIYEIDGGYVI